VVNAYIEMAPFDAVKYEVDVQIIERYGAARAKDVIKASCEDCEEMYGG